MSAYAQDKKGTFRPQCRRAGRRRHSLPRALTNLPVGGTRRPRGAARAVVLCVSCGVPRMSRIPCITGSGPPPSTASGAGDRGGHSARPGCMRPCAAALLPFLPASCLPVPDHRPVVGDFRPRACCGPTADAARAGPACAGTDHRMLIDWDDGWPRTSRRHRPWPGIRHPGARRASVVQRMGAKRTAAVFRYSQGARAATARPARIGGPSILPARQRRVGHLCNEVAAAGMAAC